MSIFTKKIHIFFKRIINLSSMFRWICRCQKWIPDKFLHRNDNSIFFQLTFFFDKFFHFENFKNIFRKKKEILKIYIGKLFFRYRNLHRKKYFSYIKFENFLFFENIFLKFWKWKILSKKKLSWKKTSYHFDVEICQESIFGIDKCSGTCWTGLLCAWKNAHFLVKIGIYRLWEFQLQRSSV